MNTAKVLYITYDGITDHIGQSQVAPYLLGLAAKGHQITLLSAEKMERADIIEKYTKIFAEGGVDWVHVPYHKKPAVVSSVYDIMHMRKVGRSIIRRKGIQVVHTRSYVPALLGLHFKLKMGVKFIFDMRDFWADAGKEIKRFDVDNNKVHRAVYRFFKAKEAQFLKHADHIISLTESGKRVMQGWKEKGMDIPAPITVIPCCADFRYYDRGRLDPQRITAMRRELGIADDEFVLNYLGSLGPSYLTDEMLDVFKVLLRRKPNAKFLVVANNDHHLVTEAAARKGIPADRLIVRKGSKEEVPYYIAQSDLSLFFIIPSFAKQACSPTKLAELLAMDVPVIGNTGVGDLDAILQPDVNHSAVMHSFDDAEYDAQLTEVLRRIEAGGCDIREHSRRFDLPFGVESYDRVYQSLVKPTRA